MDWNLDCSTSLHIDDASTHTRLLGERLTALEEPSAALTAFPVLAP